MPYYPPAISGFLKQAPSANSDDTVQSTSSSVTQLIIKSPVLTPSPVTWTQTSGVSVSGNTITKTAAGNAWFSAGGNTTQQITTGKNGYIQATVADNTSSYMFGLSNTANTGHAPLGGDFMFSLAANGTAGSYHFTEAGGELSGGTYSAGDVFKVSENNGVITYYINGSLVRTSGNAPTFPLAGQVNFFTNGASISPTMITDLSAAQSVDMMEFQDGTGTVLASVDNTGQFHPTSGMIINRKSVAASYTALSSDTYIGITNTSSARTITLPPAASVSIGKWLIIKDESGGAQTHNITIQANAAETIDGSNTQVLTTNYGSVDLVCTGTSWSIV